MGGTFLLSSGVLGVLGNGSGAYVYAIQNTLSPARVGDKWFMYARTRVTNALCALMYLQLSGSDSGATLVLSTVVPTLNAWYDLCGTGVITDQVSRARISIIHQYADAATANGKVMEVDGNAGVFAINMTALGIADYTEEQMLDLVRGGYFDGLSNVSNLTVESVGKNLCTEVWRNGEAAPNASTTVRLSVDSPIWVEAGKTYMVSYPSGTASFQCSIGVTSQKGVASYIQIATWGVTAFTALYSGWAYPVLKNTEGTAIVPTDVATAGFKLQIEEGITATAYEAHKSAKLSTNVPLRRLPNGVR